MKKTFTIVLTFLAAIAVSGQTNHLIVANSVHLPKDSIIKNLLLSNLNDFISQKEKPNRENSFVFKADLLETSALLDEMKHVEKNEPLKDDYFYKGYLSNVTKLNDTIFLIQLSYMGTNDSQSVLKAGFTLIAQKKSGRFYFSSPLKRNTVTWKSKVIGTTRFYYKNSINIKRAKAYLAIIKKYDQKLSAPDLPTEFYCCDNFPEVLQLIGVNYQADYNGIAYNTTTAKENDCNLVVNGSMTSNFNKFDPHDIWHARLRKVLSSDVINRPVDEGAAYLYGGSWGLSWEEILKKFKNFADSNPNADWLSLYNESKNYDPKASFPLNVDFAMNALLIQKIEKEKGFTAVMELLSCGKKEKSNENYFKTLEKITGIGKSNFNASIWALIKAN